jgi:PKD repeat protein
MRPYALTVSGYGVAGRGLRFIASDDRAPNTGFGADWSVCPAIIPLQDTPPTAVLAATPTTGKPPLTVTLDGSGSRDVDGDTIASYTFDFGDGSAAVTQSSPIISHTYSKAANYVSRLTVTDSRGTKSINGASKFISVVADAGTATVNVSVSPSQIKQGSTATFTVSAAKPVSQSTNVSYSMSGSASLGSDYTLNGTPGQVTIAAGQPSGSVTLNAVSGRGKKKKTATMTLQSGSGYKVGKANKATVTITP